MARSVKPLLAALDVAHQVEIGLGMKHSTFCEVCRLIAEWRRPIK